MGSHLLSVYSKENISGEGITELFSSDELGKKKLHLFPGRSFILSELRDESWSQVSSFLPPPPGSCHHSPVYRREVHSALWLALFSVFSLVNFCIENLTNSPPRAFSAYRFWKKESLQSCKIKKAYDLGLNIFAACYWTTGDLIPV